MKLVLSHVDVALDGRMILQELDLTLTSGLTVLMGPSGVGKTTLLRVIAGLIPPLSGNCQRDGKPAIVFQDARLLPWQNTIDNAGFALRARGFSKKEARNTVEPLLERVGLTREDFLKLPSALSGGMRQRVAIARALSIEPDLLLMDEPFNALDVSLRAEMRTLISQIVAERKLAAILVTHDPVEAVTLADTLLVLGGRPARIVVSENIHQHILTPADAYTEAARLMKRPEIAEIFRRSFRSHSRETD